MYGIYRATFDDGSEETVKADGFMQALGLVVTTWQARAEQLISLAWVRALLADETAEPSIEPEDQA